MCSKYSQVEILNILRYLKLFELDLILAADVLEQQLVDFEEVALEIFGRDRDVEAWNAVQFRLATHLGTFALISRSPKVELTEVYRSFATFNSVR